MAFNGKFITVREQLGEVPNGTAFSITLGPAPELDATQLAVGQACPGCKLQLVPETVCTS